MNRLLGNNTRRPDISFRPDGCIDITSRIVRLLRLSPGDVIDVAEIYPGEYCLYVRHNDMVYGRHEGRCYPVIKCNTTGAYRAWSKRLTDAMQSVSGIQNIKLKFPCGTPITQDNKIFIPIILKLPL